MTNSTKTITIDGRAYRANFYGATRQIRAINFDYSMAIVLDGQARYVVRFGVKADGRTTIKTIDGRIWTGDCDEQIQVQNCRTRAL